ncbi:levodione reductase [Colletotrichum liriopes]|uniref:Levodione reductase n=1 Tax=Colletotrichum liriopes TaxID=708192 RepID=A0AA37LQY3_9PEZI|nr:levodione reductase [Colletotrichum liriopes]
MASSFSDRVIIVIGSASGMGLATANTLLAEGAKVGMSDIDGITLDKAVKELDTEQQSRIFFKTSDVNNRQSGHFGKIDGVANFAGCGGHQLGTESVWETSDEEFDFITSLNIRGAFHGLAETLKPGFLFHGGSFVHIGSMYALQGFYKGAVFAASKHASLGMVRSAAKEVGDRARVNCVLP